MNLKEEGKDLYQRWIKLGESFVLALISLLQFGIQIGILLLTVWITVFTKGKEFTDRKTFKISNGTILPITLIQGEKW